MFSVDLVTCITYLHFTNNNAVADYTISVVIVNMNNTSQIVADGDMMVLYFIILGVRSLANASRARQFNPLNPPGVGWVNLFLFF